MIAVYHGLAALHAINHLINVSIYISSRASWIDVQNLDGVMSNPRTGRPPIFALLETNELSDRVTAFPTTRIKARPSSVRDYESVETKRSYQDSDTMSQEAGCV